MTHLKDRISRFHDGESRKIRSVQVFWLGHLNGRWYYRSLRLRKRRIQFWTQQNVICMGSSGRHLIMRVWTKGCGLTWIEIQTARMYRKQMWGLAWMQSLGSWGYTLGVHGPQHSKRKRGILLEMWEDVALKWKWYLRSKRKKVSKRGMYEKRQSWKVFWLYVLPI